MKAASFRCKKCKKNLKSAMGSFNHFQDYPKHRTKKQLHDYEANKTLARKRKQGILPPRTYDSLPTVSGGMKVVRVMKYCTTCGTRGMPSHSFCGGCGGKR